MPDLHATSQKNKGQQKNKGKQNRTGASKQSEELNERIYLIYARGRIKGRREERE